MNNTRKSRDRYRTLEKALFGAYRQASSGKGKERHADGERFEDQKICVMTRWLYGSQVGGPLFQAAKKIFESARMTPERAIRELRGTINYTSAAIILLEELLASEKSEKDPEVKEIEMNCLCLGSEDDVNAEIRRIEQKALAYVYEHGLELPE